MSNRRIFVSALFLLGCGPKSDTTTVENTTPVETAPAMTTQQAPPEAPKVPVTDTYHGEEVVDEYRWLENWDDPKVQTWTKEFDSYTRSYLQAAPNAEAIHQRVDEVLSQTSSSYHDVAYSNGEFLALKNQPPLKQALLVRLPSLSSTDNEKVIVDPNKIDESGSTTIDFFRVSPNGETIAVSLSKGGSESGDVHLFDAKTGKKSDEVVPGVNGGTAGGDLSWQADSKGFFYSRYPRGDERAAEDKNFYTQVYFHQIGTPTEEDRYEIGKDFPRIAEIELRTHLPSGRVLATIQNGDGGEFAHYLRSNKGKWKQYTKFGDRHLQMAFGPGTDLFVLSREGAPRGKILRMAQNKSVAKAKLIVPEGEDTIVNSFWGTPSIIFHNNRLFVNYQLGGPSQIRVFDAKGKVLTAPEQLENSRAGSMVAVGDKDLVFANGSWTSPTAWFQFDSASGSTSKTALASKPSIDLSKVTVERKFASSKDGTKVPVNILIPPGATLDGSTPALVTGYGGYGVSITPSYRSSYGLYLEQGIIVAVVNLRGGGEYGETWHLQGNLTNKQNVFDDFAAAIQLMIDSKYSSSDKLVIEGGSNGGLLMGATLVQNPDLVKAVVSHVGIYDMLRVELSPNGAFNITEFGTVTNADHYKALRAYSPLHNLRTDRTYPDVFLLTGANDPRVDPMQSRKFAAKLAEGGSKVLMRTSFGTGHGGGTPLNERIDKTADVIAFILQALERDFQAPAAN